MHRLGVFVVEDSAVSAAAIKLALSRDPIFEYLGTAPTSAEALAQCRDLKPAVITLDLNMPGRGGLETLSEIKDGCETPVVVVSSSTYEGSPITAEAFMRGADACFDKRRLLSDVSTFLAVLRLAASPIPD